MVTLKGICRRLTFAAKLAFSLFLTPLPRAPKQSKKQLSVKVDQSNGFSWDNFRIFPANLPDHYPLHKKLTLMKSQSKVGKFWDIFLVFLSVLACVLYVAQTYVATFLAVSVYSVAENVITQFFAVDFVFNFFCAPNYAQYLIAPWTIIDLVTIIPVYITLALSGQHRINLSIFRFVRILRLVRILRTFRILGGFSGVQRQIITLSLTLTSLVFMAAGIIQIMENDVKAQLEYKCAYIGPYTDWQPSCSMHLPAGLIDNCDCDLHHCSSYYNGGDLKDQPSGVRCVTLTFLDAFYFMVVTGKTSNL